jgi:probable rRNA maturation factor
MTPTMSDVPPDLVDLLIEDDRWRDLHLSGLAQTACRTTLMHLGHDPAGYEISLLACNDARIAALNGDFRDRPAATNVLSWPSQDRASPTPGGPPRSPPTPASGQTVELGDIAIAYDTCLREAVAAQKPPPQHVFHLLVHSTLHLLGYDHISQQDAHLMEGLEREVLATLGHPNPYEDH